MYSITTKLASDDQDMKKAELLLEFPDLPTRRAAKLRKQQKLTMSVLLSGNGETGLNLTGPTSAVFVNSNLLELTRDITEFYNRSKQNLLEEIDLSVKILRKGGKTLNSLMRRNAKAFVLVYQKVRSCNFVDFLHQDARYRRSLDSTSVEKAPQTDKAIWTHSPKSEHCFVKEMELDFQDLGLDWIFHPVSYNMGTCGGKCSFRNYHSGYEFLERIFNEKTKRGQSSSCQPVEFGSMAVIFSDHSDNRPVIAKFTEMVVTQCGCTY